MTTQIQIKSAASPTDPVPIVASPQSTAAGGLSVRDNQFSQSAGKRLRLLAASETKPCLTAPAADKRTTTRKPQP